MIKKIITRILELVFTLVLFLLITCLIFVNTIGSKNYMLNLLAKNNYYEEVYHDIRNVIEGYTIQLGISDEELDSLYSKDKVREDVGILIDGIYENKEIKINSGPLTDKLEEIINNRLKENNRSASSEEREAIKKLKSDVADVYEGGIIFSSKYINSIGKAYAKISPYFNYAIIIMVMLSIILLASLLLINRRLKSKIRSVSTSLLAVGLISLIIKILLEHKFQNILILSGAFSKLIVSIINNIFFAYLVIGIILCVIGIIGIVFGTMRRKTKVADTKDA